MKKLKQIIITTLVLGLLAVNFPFSANAATNDHTVYDDGLQNSWSSWSWSSTINFSDTSHPKTGTKNISWKPNSAWAGLYLHKNVGINTTGYTHLRFSIQSSGAGDFISVMAYGSNDGPLGGQMLLQNYGGDPVAGSYKTYDIPLIDLGAKDVVMNGFHIQEQTGGARPTLYLDDISLVSTIVTPTVTPSPTATPTTTPLPSVTPTATVLPTPTSTPSPTTLPSQTPTPSPTTTPSNGTDFNRGLVTITFDDASKTQFTNGFPVMQKYGFQGTYYLTTGSLDGYWYMTPANILTLHEAGNQMAAHTLDHADLTTITEDQLDQELREPKEYLENLLGVPVNDFCTPYGSYNPSVLTQINKYYRSHRTTEEGYNTKANFNIHELLVQNIYSNTTNKQIKKWVNQAQEDNSWLILVYHEIKSNPGQYDVSTRKFDAHLNTIKNTGAPVVTVDEALNELLPQL